MSVVADVRAARAQAAQRLFQRPTPGGWFAAIVLVAVAALVGIPSLAVLIISLRQGLPGQVRPFTLANYLEVLGDPFTWEVMGNTFAFAAGTLLVTLVFAVPIVWLVTRTDLPGKETIYLLMTV